MMRIVHTAMDVCRDKKEQRKCILRKRYKRAFSVLNSKVLNTCYIYNDILRRNKFTMTI